MDSVNRFNCPRSLQLDASNLEEEWKFWVQKFDLYLLASANDQKPAATKLAIFLHCIGDEALKVYNSFVFDPESDSQVLSTVRERFKDYCMPRKNIVFERYNFGKLVQQPGESIDSFVTTLRLRAQSCDYKAETEGLIRDRVVLGCLDSRVQERLLREPALTLQKALDICRAAETSKEQMKSLTGNSSTATCISTVHKKQTANVQANSSRSAAADSAPCSNCATYHAPKQCPAYGKSCLNCKKKNHFKVCCRSRPADKATGQQRQRSQSSSRGGERQRGSAARPIHSVDHSDDDDE